MKPAVYCHICDQSYAEQDGSPEVCGRCGADLSNPEKEKKIMEDTLRARFATSDRLGDNGKEANVYLTDKRFIAIPVKLQGFGLTGVVTAAIYNSMYKDMGIVSIALKDVKSVRDGKFGLLAKAIIIETAGNEMIKFTVSKRNEWMEAL